MKKQKRMSNNGIQENENEINACLGKLPLLIHVLSQTYVVCMHMCEG